jgi:hypothetical protein
MSDEFDFDNLIEDEYEDDQYDNYGNDYARDDMFVQGVNQYEHMGEFNPIYQEFGDYDMSFKDRYKKYGGLSGEERFRKLANQFINENDEMKALPKLEINDYITKLQQIEYKNPKAFIVAFFFIYSGEKNSNLAKKVSYYCRQKEDDKDMTVEDIIRYVRLLRTLK